MLEKAQTNRCRVSFVNGRLSTYIPEELMPASTVKLNTVSFNKKECIIQIYADKEGIAGFLPKQNKNNTVIYRQIDQSFKSDKKFTNIPNFGRMPADIETLPNGNVQLTVHGPFLPPKTKPYSKRKTKVVKEKGTKLIVLPDFPPEPEPEKSFVNLFDLIDEINQYVETFDKNKITLEINQDTGKIRALITYGD